MQHCIILNANKAVGCGIFRRFSNIDICRPEADGGVISGVALDYVGTDVCAGFGVSRLNSGRIVRLFVWPDQLLDTFVQYLITFFSRLEAVSYIISGIFVVPVVLDKHLKFHDPSLNRSREIPPVAVGGSIFDCFPL